MTNKELAVRMGSILNKLWIPDQSRLEKCLTFVGKLVTSEHEYDLTPMAQRFLHHVVSHQYKFEPVTPEETQYLADIDALHDCHPLRGLKIAMIDIAFAVTGLHHELLAHISSRLHAWLLDDAIPRAIRIEWGTELWINLPITGHAYDRDCLIAPLYRVFIDEAKSSPAFVAAKYELIAKAEGNNQGSPRTYLFNQFIENPMDFVELSRLIHAEKPELLLFGLQRLLWEGGRYQRKIKNNEPYDSPYQPTEAFLRAVANELFSVSSHNSPNEMLCQNLLLEAYPDEAWYQSLLDRLWVIEKQKGQPDANSITNHFIVHLNSPRNSRLALEAERKIRDWVFGYKILDSSSYKLIIEHARAIIKLVNDACHPDYPFTRNRYTQPDLGQAGITLMINVYWEMVDWLTTSHAPLALYALMGGASANSFATPLTIEISHNSKKRLIGLFTMYVQQHITECSILVEIMIRDSIYSNYKHDYSAVLDKIYSALYAASPSVATKTLERGEINESHSSTWRPR